MCNGLGSSVGGEQVLVLFNRISSMRMHYFTVLCCVVAILVQKRNSNMKIVGREVTVNKLGLSCAKLSTAWVGCLLASQLILTQPAYAETTYYTQFSYKAVLSWKINFHGWVEKWRIRLSSAWLSLANVQLTHHFREEFIIVKMAIREKFTRFKKIFTPDF